MTSPCVENVKELPAWSSCLRLTIVKLDPGKEKSGEILFNHLETAQSEAKASPRKPKVVSLCKSENWGCKPLSTKPSMKLKIVHMVRRLYLGDLARSVWTYHGRHLGHNLLHYLMHHTSIARNVTKEDATPTPLSLTVILDKPKSSRRT